MKLIPKRKKFRKRVIVFVSLIAGILSIISVSASLYDRHKVESLDGDWEVEFITNETSYDKYIGMSIVHKIHFTQTGRAYEAVGESWYADGEKLPVSRHRKIILKGDVKKSILKGTFTFYGALRESHGSINAKVSNNGSQFEGSFTWTAADSKGRIIGKKVFSK